MEMCIVASAQKGLTKTKGASTGMYVLANPSNAKRKNVKMGWNTVSINSIQI